MLIIGGISHELLHKFVVYPHNVSIKTYSSETGTVIQKIRLCGKFHLYWFLFLAFDENN